MKSFWDGGLVVDNLAYILLKLAIDSQHEQGGSFRACYWRTQIDLLLINVARESFCTMGMYELRPLLAGDPTFSDFQLALLKSLLASFLSSPDNCPYLERGLELFNKGNTFFQVLSQSVFAVFIIYFHMHSSFANSLVKRRVNDIQKKPTRTHTHEIC